jgi:hypothetical protein
MNSESDVSPKTKPKEELFPKLADQHMVIRGPDAGPKK